MKLEHTEGDLCKCEVGSGSNRFGRCDGLQRMRARPVGMAGHCFNTRQGCQITGSFSGPPCVVCEPKSLVNHRQRISPSTLPKLDATQAAQPEREYADCAAFPRTLHGSAQHNSGSINFLTCQMGDAQKKRDLIAEVDSQAGRGHRSLLHGDGSPFGRR